MAGTALAPAIASDVARAQNAQPMRANTDAVVHTLQHSRAEFGERPCRAYGEMSGLQQRIRPGIRRDVVFGKADPLDLAQARDRRTRRFRGKLLHAMHHGEVGTEHDDAEHQHQEQRQKHREFDRGRGADAAGKARKAQGVAWRVCHAAY